MRYFEIALSPRLIYLHYYDIETRYKLNDDDIEVLKSVLLQAFLFYFYKI